MFDTILIDLDDTLIKNQYSYYIPQLEAAQMIIRDLEEYSASPIEILHRANELQIQNIKELGYISKVCFSNSFLTVYRELCKNANREPNHKIEGAIIVSTTKYILQKYKLFPNVKETLTNISQKKILVTRGNKDIQEYKINNAELNDCFDAIEIVDLKNKATYESIIYKYKLIPEKTIMIGDSLRNDILPALEAGLNVIHIKPFHVSNWCWEGDLSSINESLNNYNFHTIDNFSEIVKYLG